MIGYSLILPLGPSINHYYQRNRNGGVRISEEGEAFRKEVWAAVKQSGMPKLLGRVCLIVRVFPRDKRTQDIDNRIKATMDALQHAQAFENDSQVDELKVSRGSIVPGGRMEIMVGEIECHA